MISIAVHGGAGPDSEFIQRNQLGYTSSLAFALNAGYDILKRGGTALDAVEQTVRLMEDNPLFNAGRGAALTIKGDVEMDASIMDGSTLRAGAVSIVRNVKNPITLARTIMDRTSHVYLSGDGAREFAKDHSLELESDDYFITEHRVEEHHGTVGAVALDQAGNLAAATSTGGTSNSLNGRVGDSCIIGAGCYANNASCSVSGTGEGELLIRNVIAHSIAFYMELTHCSVQEACDHVIHERNNYSDGDIGVIAVDAKGNIGLSFNSERMHRAWKMNEDEIHVNIYKHDHGTH